MLELTIDTLKEWNKIIKSKNTINKIMTITK